MPQPFASETLSGTATERSPKSMADLERDMKAHFRTFIDDHFEEYCRLTGEIGMSKGQATADYRKFCARILLDADSALTREITAKALIT